MGILKIEIWGMVAWKYPILMVGVVFFVILLKGMYDLLNDEETYMTEKEITEEIELKKKKKKRR